MDNVSYVLLSQEQALRRRLDVVANNIANSSTAGFRREMPLFHEYVERGQNAAGPPGAPTSFVLDYGTVHDLTPGAFQPTSNPLDLMIDGSGYFAVQGEGGQTLYTRSGQIRLLPTGELGTPGGQPILGDGGAPVVIPPDQAHALSIAGDGTVSGPQGVLGRLAITRFENEAALSPVGAGLLTGAGGVEVPAAETKLLIGGIESSNVQPIAETTAMIEVLRSYQTSQRLSDSLTEMRQRAIERLGRVN